MAEPDFLNPATDEEWMRLALAQAEEAGRAGEVPVGAVVVLDGELIARGRNSQIGSADPTAHAEVVALRAAAARVGNYRLTGATLYVTLEPCTMCLGATVHARIERIVFAASEPRAGAVALLVSGRFNHAPSVEAGCLEAESAALLVAFFQARRG